MTRHTTTYSALDFFAGSGLVGLALAPYYVTAWACDIDKRKAATYRANLDPAQLHVCDVASVDGTTLPPAALSWASFPCQDLSLAGKLGGVTASRSGLVWHWLRTLEEQADDAPRVVCAENVAGLVSSNRGHDYASVHAALAALGYRVGCVLLNASRWIPQSRPRVFVVGTRGTIPDDITSDGPTWAHPAAVVRAAGLVDGFTWWRIPEPPPRVATVADIVQHGQPWDATRTAELIPPRQLAKLTSSGRKYATAYRRTRGGVQVTELRCDGVAGCLRTPAGGSSRQYLVKLDDDGKPVARLLTAREVARLMGAPDSYVLPANYREAYHAMGDAVAVPVVSWLAKYLLLPLTEAAYG